MEGSNNSPPLRPPEPEAVGSNPALPATNPISGKQLPVKVFFLAVVNRPGNPGEFFM